MTADGDPTRLRLTAACAACEHFLGRHEDAQARLHAALDALPVRLACRCRDLDGPRHRRLLHDGDRADVRPRRPGGRGRTSSGDEGLLFAGLGASRPCPVAFESLGEAEESAQEAEVLARSLSDDALAERLDGVNRLAWATLGLQRFEDAVSHAARGMRVARQTGQDGSRPCSFPPRPSPRCSSARCRRDRAGDGGVGELRASPPTTTSPAAF